MCNGTGTHSPRKQRGDQPVSQTLARGLCPRLDRPLPAGGSEPQRVNPNPPRCVSRPAGRHHEERSNPPPSPPLATWGAGISSPQPVRVSKSPGGKTQTGPGPTSIHTAITAIAALRLIFGKGNFTLTVINTLEGSVRFLVRHLGLGVCPQRPRQRGAKTTDWSRPDWSRQCGHR